MKQTILGRLFWVDLIKWVSNVRLYVRMYVRQSTKSFFEFKKIWYVGRVEVDDWCTTTVQYDPIQRQGHEPFTMGAGNWPRILKLGQII